MTKYTIEVIVNSKSDDSDEIQTAITEAVKAKGGTEIEVNEIDAEGVDEDE